MADRCHRASPIPGSSSCCARRAAGGNSLRPVRSTSPPSHAMRRSTTHGYRASSDLTFSRPRSSKPSSPEPSRPRSARHHCEPPVCRSTGTSSSPCSECDGSQPVTTPTALRRRFAFPDRQRQPMLTHSVLPKWATEKKPPERPNVAPDTLSADRTTSANGAKLRHFPEYFPFISIT